MTIKEQIKILEGLIDQITIEQKKTDDMSVYIRQSKEIAVLTQTKTRLMHSLGIKTEEEQEHERVFGA